MLNSLSSFIHMLLVCQIISTETKFRVVNKETRSKTHKNDKQLDGGDPYDFLTTYKGIRCSCTVKCCAELRFLTLYECFATHGGTLRRAHMVFTW